VGEWEQSLWVLAQVGQVDSDRARRRGPRCGGPGVSPGVSPGMLRGSSGDLHSAYGELPDRMAAKLSLPQLTYGTRMFGEQCTRRHEGFPLDGFLQTAGLFPPATVRPPAAGRQVFTVAVAVSTALP
jgi:hypothetical protein